MVSKNKCRLCGESLSQGAEKADMKYCAECTADAAALLLNYIVEQFDPEGNAEIQIMIGLFLQAAEMLYWLPDFRGLVGAEKRCLS
jgi:hypothetical protein